jgi:hypothetical protein
LACKNKVFKDEVIIFYLSSKQDIIHKKVSWVVGLNVVQNNDGVIYNQEKYVKDVIARYNMNDAKTLRNIGFI